ncbi:hypothetical protein GCM10010406_55540 [Streptomyces thermolineatus]|uniref:PPE family domain-containing protein n=1 Tax=Streptomyces thermolineatus TaxID=44033 RepID=A0ABP6A8G5_9ACTN
MGDERTEYEYTEPTACYAGKHSTQFSGKTLPEMKKMVADARPGEVERVSKAWKNIETKLVGGGGVKETFDAAVEAVLEHWEGAAADAFRAHAKKISKKIADSAKYAENTSVAMQGAANALKEYKPVIDNMEMPDTLDKAGDFLGDLGDRGGDKALDADLGNKVSTEDALNKHHGSLSAGKERQLEAAIVMEQLGAAYNSQTMAMGTWKAKKNDEGGDYPGDPGGTPPVAAVVPVSPAVSRPKPSAVGGGVGGGGVNTISPSKPVAPPRDSAVIGGAQKPAPGPKPQVGTVIDGISGGTGATGGSSVGGVASGGAGGSGTGGTAGGGIAGGGAAGIVGGARGVGGVGGRGAAGVSGTAGRGAAAGGGAAGRGGAAGAGRPGMPGAAGAAAGGKSGAASGRAGALARQKGGVVGGTPGAGGAGRGTAGGSGLHRSRGAAQAARGGGRPGGPMGAGVPRGRSDREREESRREGERPDYLVEDEETWATPRNVAPRVVD